MSVAENGVEVLTRVKSSPREAPNVVVLIFSKVQRDREDWMSLTKGIFETIDGWATDATGVVDLADSEADYLGPASSADKGKVYGIQARIPASTGRDAPSLEDCQKLRDSIDISAFEKAASVELMFQPFDLYLSHRIPGLAVFDMDSTLIQQEVIDELARSVGRYELVAAVTEAAMRGELDFEESLRARVAHLKGVPTDIWEHLKANVITFTPGARELIKVLKSLGWKTAVLSGGFTPLAYWVKDTLGLDYAFANQLSIDTAGSALSGEVLPGTSIVGASVKKDLLLKLAEDENISITHTIAVGDGSNDLLMMHAAGLGIAFNAKPKVQEAAPARLNSPTLLDIIVGLCEQYITPSSPAVPKRPFVVNMSDLVARLHICNKGMINHDPVCSEQNELF
ncbi:Phosphoserine phosphatase [Vermiconidia calcicola]|uniref:Phosphoserine phosphatase n=1 Tax=Vermiconidia calcicola TaxID=1690605 RepID=A0ACC3MRX1_9PEZI|nr:Phosphoserine phosphatase [Vermiconidia calcicola]